MPRPRIPELQGIESYRTAARNNAGNLKARYKDNPAGLAEVLHLKLPVKPVAKMIELGLLTAEEAVEKYGPQFPGIRELVIEVCTLAVRSAVAVGPRGGGKSQGVSFIEFFLWILKEFDALNLGGSEHQAANVYDYLVGYVESHPQWKALIEGDMKVSESKTKRKNWIKVLTASSKSVRSPHAGGDRIVFGEKVRRGGILVIDEEAEAEPDIVKAALFTINTARPSVSVRSSTFHNEAGSFAEVVDSAEEMGYKLYRWDVFDVCEGCNCTGEGCQSPEPCFREDHYENVVDPDTGQVERKMKHRAYCGGRAKYASGWVPMEEIETTWKRIKRNHETFEIEQMGSRPGSKGFVIKDRTKFTESITDQPAADYFMHGFPISVTVDWGTTAAAIEAWQELPQDKHVLLYAEQIEDAGLLQIVSKITEVANMYGTNVVELAADIGGGGNYLNPYMRDRGFNVRDVAFAEEKESAAAAWNIYNEAEKTIIPAEYDLFIEQVKKWRRVNGRIAKGNDHLCDGALCYFAKFAERLGTSHLRVGPVAFSSKAGAAPVPIVPGDPLTKREPSVASKPQLIAPVAVTFGPRR